jgi:hypothetical protein
VEAALLRALLADVVLGLLVVLDLGEVNDRRSFSAKLALHGPEALLPPL